MKIFDRELLKLRANGLHNKHLEPNFLRLEIAERNMEKLNEINNNFQKGLEIGAGVGEFYSLLNSQKIAELWQGIGVDNVLNHNPYPNKILLDEENINLKDNSFDIVISNFSLHNINNPADAFKNIYRILSQGGAFLMSIPIAGTLYPLNEVLFDVEMRLFNGVSPRIHPFADITTLGNLVQAAGFQDITVDKDKIAIMYSSVDKIFADLKNAGQNNILTNRNKNYVGKNFFKEVELGLQKYKEQNHYPITIEFANLIAWK
ncbi:MAG: methyltransferase domain-containing protein [Alphaproteobacteria bacterium]|jgi:SAM-dependent methyltransferase|nr:methyltransferase domain-containing protein [Alphaproteobacteria bacterium]